MSVRIPTSSAAGQAQPPTRGGHCRTGPLFDQHRRGTFQRSGIGGHANHAPRPPGRHRDQSRSERRQVPIDTARYRKLAIKLRVSNAPAASGWWRTGSRRLHGAELPEPRRRARLPGSIPSGTSEQVYVFDLAQAGTRRQPARTAHAAGAGVGTRRPGPMKPWCAAYRIDPISSATLQGVEIDWVRLTASNASPSAALMTVDLACVLRVQQPRGSPTAQALPTRLPIRPGTTVSGASTMACFLRAPTHCACRAAMAPRAGRRSR